MSVNVPLWLFIIICFFAVLGVLASLLLIILLADFITMLIQDKKQYGVNKNDNRN